MITKSILAASAVAATLAVAAPAEAKTHIYLGIGVPAYGYDYDPAFDYPPPPPPRPRHRPRPIYEPDFDYGYDDGISCREGRQIVRYSGFRNVRTVECDGQNFKYTGYRRGDTWLVMIDSRTGEIIRRYRY